VEHEIAGDLEKEIPEKEDSGSESELLAGDCQLPIHRQCRKSEVDAIDKGNNVESKQEGDKPNL
jgi:hypothetical protein